MQDQEANPLAVAGVAWLLCFAAMLSFGYGNVVELNLLNDDYVRLVQVYDFLDGQSWHDLTQYRLAPPDGLAMHWSRLPDLPLALMIGASEGWLGREAATQVALAVIAGLYLLALFVLTSRIGLLFGTRRLSNLCVLYALFGLYTIVQFVPGRIDHHSLQIILSLAVLLCVLLSLGQDSSDRRRGSMALAAGVIATLSMSIGLEALPILIAANASYGLLWALGRPGALKAGGVFAVASVATALFIAGMLSPPGSITATNCDTLSGTYIALLGLIAGLWGLLWLLQPAFGSSLTRVAGGGILAAGAAGLFAALVPHCIAGPYSEVDPLLRDLWLGNISEAKGIADLLQQPDRLVSAYAYPLIAFASLVALAVMKRLGAPERSVPLATFLLIAFLVSLSQIRFGSFAQAFAVFPVAMLANELMARAPKLSMPVVRLAPTVAILAVLNPLAVTIPASSLVDRPDKQGLDRTASARCGLPHSLAALAALPKARILGFTDVGPELLFFTPHEVFAAPYHRNTDGLLMTMQFFTSGDEAVAQGLAARSGADYLLFCEDLPESNLYSAQGEDNIMVRLLRHDTPAWLEPVPDLGGNGLRVYRIGTEAATDESDAKPYPATLDRVVD